MGTAIRPPTEQPVRVRLRGDLIVAPRSTIAASRVVKDPVALRYFTFRAEEYAILQMLDGTKSLEELCEQFERQFPPQRMTPQRLQEFLANLHQNGLVLSEEPGQASVLLEQDQRARSRERWRAWMNVLAIRFRGFDPERFLTWLYSHLKWCFSPLFLAACLLVAVAAMVLMVVQADEFRRQLPTLSSFLSASNLVWLAVTLAGVKVVHELAHGLTCKHYGGECHEMGFMLLVFTPCLYCDVTDSWMLPSRRQRIAIAAAGIVAEVFLAAVAVFVWHFTQPGLAHTIAMNTVLVCGVGTVLINGNPLLRYDGYFILSDLLEKPNLWQESRAVIRKGLSRLLLDERPDGRTQPRQRTALLATYGVASMAYRAFVLVAILLFLYRALAPLRLELLAQALAATTIIGGVAVWLPAWSRSWKNPLFWQRAGSARVAVAVALGAALLAGVLYVPLPCRISAPALVQSRGSLPIYVSTPGTLIEAVPEGAPVAAGELLARLEDAALSREVAQLAGQRERAGARVRHLESRSAVDQQVAAELVVARELLADVEERLEQRRREEQALTIAAPVAGTVIPAAPRADSNYDASQLPTWTGSPLEPRNRSCYLERGMLLCLVGSADGQEAVVFVDETDVQLVRTGQRVRLRFDVGPAAVIEGRVAEIAQGEVQFVPQELAATKELAIRGENSANGRPMRTSYQVRVTFEQGSAPLVIGTRGWAKIDVDPQTLGQRLLRAVRRVLTVDI